MHNRAIDGTDPPHVRGDFWVLEDLVTCLIEIRMRYNEINQYEYKRPE